MKWLKLIKTYHPRKCHKETPLFFKSLIISLKALFYSIIFLGLLTAIFYLLTISLGGIDFGGELKKPSYLVLYLKVIFPFWLVLLPFFSPYLAPPTQRGPRVKFILAKLFVYSFCFVSFGGLQQTLLVKNNLNNEKIVEASQTWQRKMGLKEKSQLSVQVIDKYLSLSGHFQTFVFEKKKSGIAFVCLYNLYVLMIIFFERKGKNPVHHYLRNIGFATSLIMGSIATLALLVGLRSDFIP